MSNLLNNDKPKKKLLNRGPKIVPEQEFVLEDKVIETPSVEPSKTGATVVKPPKKASKKIDATSITSVRVSKATRSNGGPKFSNDLQTHISICVLINNMDKLFDRV